MKVFAIMQRASLLIFAILLAGSVVQGQVSAEDGEEVGDKMGLATNYSFPEYAGRCHKCVFASDVSVYLAHAPVCNFEWDGQVYNIAEYVDAKTCFNDDPRLYEDIECKTPLLNDTFDCNSCAGQTEIGEGQTIQLAADQRCTYRVNFWNKKSLAKRQILFTHPSAKESQSSIEYGNTEQSSLVPYSPYKDEVYFWITDQPLELLKGLKVADRNNVLKLATPRWEELVLKDGQYFTVINMSEETINFTLSGKER